MQLEIADTPSPAIESGFSAANAVRWLHAVGGVQYWLLAVWFAFVSFLPQNVYALVFLIILLPVWGVAILLGLWHLVKTPGERLYSVGIIVAYPAVVALSGLLMENLPFVTGRAGVVSFFAVLFFYPAIWLTKWLWRINAPPKGTESTLPMRIVVGAVAAMLIASLILISGLFTNNVFALFNEFFGDRWLSSGLLTIAGLIIGLLAIAVPYAVRGIRKGNRRDGIILAASTGLTIFALLIGSVVYMLLALTYG